MSNIRYCALMILMLGVMTRGLSAADGVVDIKINPAATTVINASGSYRLVSDVTMTVNAAAISITANAVTLDLGGHSITAFGTSTTDGISASGYNRIVIFSGGVNGFGGDGVDVGPHSTVRDMRLTDNGKSGGASQVRVSERGTVEGCTLLVISPATGSATGIYANGAGCRVSNNLVDSVVSQNNFAMGIRFASGGGIVENNRVKSVAIVGGGSIAYGISGQDQMRIIGNTVDSVTGQSGLYGISTSASSIVEGNTVRGCSTVGAGSAEGIATTANAVIRGNTVENVDNTGTGSARGINTSFNSLIEGNTVSDCDAASHAFGIQAAGENKIIGNTCRRNDSTNNGNAIGIEGSGNSYLIKDNVCTGNTEGPNAVGTSAGIRLAGGGVSSIIDNVCNMNNGNGNGSGRGILASGDCLVRGNTCSNNQGAGTGNAAGIEISGNNCKVEENLATVNVLGVASYGILVTGADNLIARNRTGGNVTSIHLGGSGNRAEQNRMTEGAVSLVGGNTEGTGDFVNVPF